MTNGPTASDLSAHDQFWESISDLRIHHGASRSLATLHHFDETDCDSAPSCGEVDDRAHTRDKSENNNFVHLIIACFLAEFMNLPWKLYREHRGQPLSCVTATATSKSSSPLLHLFLIFAYRSYSCAQFSVVYYFLIRLFTPAVRKKNDEAKIHISHLY